MKRAALIVFAVVLGMFALTFAQGPLTPADNLRVRSDSNGYLLVSPGAYAASDGPLTNFGNLRLRTDSNGYLLVTMGGSGLWPVAQGGTGADNTTQTWTPTCTSVTNIASTTCTTVNPYARVGAVVSGSFVINVTATAAATFSEVGVSLPIASNIGQAADAGGTCVSVTSGAGQTDFGIIGDITNDRLRLLGTPTVNSTITIACDFSYRVI